MKGILWHMAINLEGIFDGILMEFNMRISEDKNQIQKSMYIPCYLSSGIYSSGEPLGRAQLISPGFDSRPKLTVLDWGHMSLRWWHFCSCD